MRIVIILWVEGYSDIPLLAHIAQNIASNTFPRACPGVGDFFCPLTMGHRRRVTSGATQGIWSATGELNLVPTA